MLLVDLLELDARVGKTPFLTQRQTFIEKHRRRRVVANEIILVLGRGAGGKHQGRERDQRELRPAPRPE